MQRRRLFDISKFKFKTADASSPPVRKPASGIIRSLLSRIPKPSPTSGCLPTELHILIISFLPPDTKLYPLLFVNDAFYFEAERLLYTDILITEAETKHFRRSTRLFIRLSQTARLANLTQTFNLHAFVCAVARDSPDRLRRYWQNLSVALREMLNLKEFTMGKVSMRDGTLAQPTNDLFTGCKFRLRKLAIWQFGPQDYRTLQGEVCMGLEELEVSRQVDRRLNLAGFSRLNVLEITDMPQDFWDSMPELMSPPRDVKAISLRCSVSSLWQGPTYTGVHSLRIELQGNWVGPQVGIVFPSLRFLRIDYPLTEYGDTISDWTLKIRLTAAQPPNLVHLRKITFGMKAGIYWMRRKAVKQLFSRISALEIVCFGGEEWNRASGERAKPDKPERWDEWKDKAWWD